MTTTSSKRPDTPFLGSESVEKVLQNFPGVKRVLPGFQPLLKDDHVFTLTSELEETPSWTGLLNPMPKSSDGRMKGNCKFTTGNVILDKKWSDSNFNLAIKWKNDKIEKLSQNSTSKYIAYGDRLFVLDRECVGPQSRVYLAGYPEIQGIVQEKKFLATGRYTKNPDVILEDVDVSLLHRPLVIIKLVKII